MINPSKPMLEFNPDAIPVYMEQRAYKQVGKYKVSGKFDFVAEGRVQDFKSTGVFILKPNQCRKSMHYKAVFIVLILTSLKR